MDETIKIILTKNGEVSLGKTASAEDCVPLVPAWMWIEMSVMSVRNLALGGFVLCRGLGICTR